MSTNIENNVVSMSFENSNFERNAKTTMNTLDKLRKALDFSGTASTLNEVSDAAGRVDMSTLQNGVQEVHNRFSALEVVAITALSRITNAAIDTGVKVTKALTLDSVMSGFSEYELMMNSVQTIMSGTGESLDTVMSKLNELNQYADDTIYVFSDMTQNIGKFTNAGVKLDTAVAAMKGLSNEAALAGANAVEASRAMYNIAQSLSMGYMQYIDWKSIENANMATKDFKENLVETALELGTLNEAAVKAQPSINALFKEKLKDGWLTNDVLLTTLEKYADNTTELGKKAYAAAQDVKTFSQMWDTLTEAAGSGWSQTFSYIIGDFEQAKKLWTGVGNYFSNIIQKSAEARNALFKSWNENGGRDYVIKGLSESFQALMKILGNVNLAFHDIFKGLDGSQLHDISTSFYYFAKNLNESLAPVAKDIRRTFDGLFSVLHIGVNIVTSIGRAFAYLVGNSGIGGLGASILGVTGNFGEFLRKLDESITKNDTFYKILKRVADALLLIPRGFNAVFEALTGMGILDAIDRLSEGLGSLLDHLSNIGGAVNAGLADKINTISGAFKGLGTETGILAIIFKGVAEGLSQIAQVVFGITSQIGTAITETFKGADTRNVLDFFNTAGLLGGLSAFIIQIKNLMDPIGDIGDMIDNIREDLAILQNAVKADVILKIAEGVALLAVSCLLLASVDPDKLAGPMLAITAFITELSVAMQIMDHFTDTLPGFFGSVSGIMNAFAQSQKATILVKMAAAVLLLAGALKVISSIETSKLKSSVEALLVLLAGLTAASLAIDKFGSKFKTNGFITMATGLLILSASLKVIASIKPEALVGAVISLGLALAGLTAAATALSFMNPVSLAAGGAALLLMANGLLIVSLALKVISSIDPSALTGTVISLGVALAGLTVALTGLSFMNPVTMLAGAGALLIAANAMVILSGSLKILSTLGADGLNTALTAFCVSLLGLAGALLLMRTALPGAAALIVAAGAIAILAPSLALLAAIPFGSLMAGLLGAAVAIGALAAGAFFLSPLLPLMAGLSGVLAIFGVACLSVGAGVALLATGLSILAVSGVAGATALVSALAIILGAIPMLVNAVALLVETLIRAYMNLMPLYLQAVVLTIKSICEAILQTLPVIVETVAQLLVMLMSTLLEYLPQIVEIGIDIVVALINGIAEGLPELVNAAFNLIISFIDGLGQAIDDNAVAIRDCMIRFGMHLWNAFCEFFGIHSPSLKFEKGGVFLIQGLINGINSMIVNAKNKINSLGEAMINKLNEKKEEFKSIGVNFISGLINGIESMRNAVVSKAEEIGGALLSKFRSLFDIHSPSRVMFAIGQYIDEGLLNGLVSMHDKVAKAGADVANSVRDALVNGINNIDDWNDGFNFSPTIKPLIDLTEIQNGASSIKNMLNREFNTGASIEIAALTNRDNRSASAHPQVIKQEITNNYEMNQTNYSPKALDTYTLYRQSRNLLSQIEGVPHDKIIYNN